MTKIPGSAYGTLRHTECKHLLFEAARRIVSQDRICLQNSLGGGDFFFWLEVFLNCFTKLFI